MHEFQEKSINTISFKLDLKSYMSGPVKRHVTTLRLPDHYKYTVKVFSRFQTSHIGTIISLQGGYIESGKLYT